MRDMETGRILDPEDERCYDAQARRDAVEELLFSAGVNVDMAGIHVPFSSRGTGLQIDGEVLHDVARQVLAQADHESPTLYADCDECHKEHGSGAALDKGKWLCNDCLDKRDNETVANAVAACAVETETITAEAF